MNQLGYLLEDGGFGSFAVLALFGLGFLLAGLQLVLAKRVDLTAFVVAGPVAMLLAGLVASLVGCIRTFGALAMVEPDLKAAIAAQGFSEALAPTVLALGLCLIACAFVALAVTARANGVARRG